MRTDYATRSTSRVGVLYILLLAAGAVTPVLAGGNYCSTTDRILFTSNRNSLPPATGPATETYNLFVMDGKGGNRRQLTEDRWPVMNQHPVFTTDCRQVLWVRGAPGHNAIWIMNSDGSARKRITAPPAGNEDAHPWAGSDGKVYFSRHSHGNHAHAIWRINLDGSGQSELIGGHADRFHPNLRRDGNLVLYTSGPAGSGEGTEIRVFDQSAGADRVLYSPGWPVSAAIWHPDGTRAVVAEDPQRSGRYSIVEIGYPGGTRLRTLTDNLEDNTIPYYAYPSGASIDWVRWAGGKTPRGIARMNADGTGQAILTNDPYDNALILGEPEIVPATGTGSGATAARCIPKPVGCSPSPPPCDRVLLPNAIQSNAEQLGLRDGRAAAASGTSHLAELPSYSEFLQAALRGGDQAAPRQDIEARRAALALREFLAGKTDPAVQERVAEFYVNSYRIGLTAR
jgi:hypothetical protein